MKTKLQIEAGYNTQLNCHLASNLLSTSLNLGDELFVKKLGELSFRKMDLIAFCLFNSVGWFLSFNSIIFLNFRLFLNSFKFAFLDSAVDRCSSCKSLLSNFRWIGNFSSFIGGFAKKCRFELCRRSIVLPRFVPFDLLSEESREEFKLAVKLLVTFTGLRSDSPLIVTVFMTSAMVRKSMNADMNLAALLNVHSIHWQSMNESQNDLQTVSRSRRSSSGCSILRRSVSLGMFSVVTEYRCLPAAFVVLPIDVFSVLCFKFDSDRRPSCLLELVAVDSAAFELLGLSKLIDRLVRFDKVPEMVATWLFWAVVETLSAVVPLSTDA